MKGNSMATAKALKPEKKAAGISDAAVHAKTGKTWSEWFILLDRAGARKMNHKQIAAYVHNELHLPSWWSQMVTVGYEQERGLREKNQTREGYQTSASKTLTVPSAVVFEAWRDAKQRQRWLPKAPLEIRTATSPKSLRITWTEDSSAVDVMIYPKGEGKCQVSVSHRKLKGQREVAQMKKYWAEALGRLQKMLG
jgi:uncharacterized protein YndB with AHSA1/START domain